jgi:uncharacterized integral membrane protein
MRQSTRTWSWIATAPITVLVVWFSVSNRDQITLHLRPFPFDLITPIWALTLIELFIGFLLGAIVTWIADRHRRRETKLLARRVSELEKQLGESRAQPTLPAVA